MQLIQLFIALCTGQLLVGLNVAAGPVNVLKGNANYGESLCLEPLLDVSHFHIAAFKHCCAGLVLAPNDDLYLCS